ncbi:hypothetical protein ACTFIW_000042 [Dictyostelium discoideum]
MRREYIWSSSMLQKIAHYGIPEQLIEQEMQSKTGGISASLNIIHNALDATLFQHSLYLRGKALKSQTQNLFHLCQTVLDYPRFEDTKRIRELIEEALYLFEKWHFIK